jgi:hypothetical protein
MNRLSTSSTERSRFPLLRPLGAALAVVAALALAFVLLAALAMAVFLGWPRGTAPDLYSQRASGPSFASKAAAVFPGLLSGAGQAARNHAMPRLARDAELSPAGTRKSQTAASAW